MISFVDATNATIAGIAPNVNALRMTPSNVQDGDVHLAVIALEPSDDANGTFTIKTPSGWTFVSTAVTAGVRGFIFVRAQNSDSEQVFQVGKPKLSDSDVTVWGALLTYRGVDPDRPLNAHVTADDIQDNPQLIVTREDCWLVYALLHVGGSASTALTQRTAFTGATPSLVGLHVADEVLTDQGATGSRTVTAAGANPLLQLLVALNPLETIAQVEDAPPTTGAGAGAYYPDVNDALRVTVKKEEGGVLVVDNDAPQVYSCQLSFNGIGACVGGSVLILDKPEWQRFARVMQFRLNLLNKPNNDEYHWYTALVDSPKRKRSPYWDVYDLKLVGLDELFLQAPVRLDSFPTVAGVIDAHRNLNRGIEQPRAANTTDELLTWRELLTKRFDGVDEAAFGVGYDYIYVQGRPSDGTPVIISALDALDAPTEKEYEPEQFVTQTYDPNAPTVIYERPDARLLTPRRIAAGETHDSVFIPAQGFRAPFGFARSYELTVSGVAIPPIIVTDLGDDGISQYASAAVVTQTASEDGSEATVSTKIVTQVLDYRPRDERGRFI